MTSVGTMREALYRARTGAGPIRGRTKGTTYA